ncbi:MAG: PEP-CTERM sorting domain-containing protein [Rhizobiales bacterium]|nr:PEP-CTERM sorting domain-containing protein [Hyphomicrobiales bacterium]
MTVTDLASPASVERVLTAYDATTPFGAEGIDVDTFIDAGNVAFGTATPLAGGGPINDFVSTSILTSLAIPIVPLYSLTIVAAYTNITGDTNLGVTLAVVTEPSSLGLLGTGLVLAGLALKRRRRRHAA